MMEVNTMKFSKKLLTVLVGVILTLGVGNVAFALLFMSRDVNITGGVSTVGSIELYEEDGVTVFTSYSYPNFTGGLPEISTKTFLIINTGNQLVNVFWNISSSSLTWNPTIDGYVYYEDGYEKYNYQLQDVPQQQYIAPQDSTSPGGVLLAPGETREMLIVHTYLGYPKTAETYSLTMTFYAEG
jgi:hypothetical protein